MTILNNLFSVFSNKEKRSFLFLCGLMVVNALVQVFGVASVAPLIAVIITPENFENSKHVNMIKEYFEFSSHQEFSIFLGLVILMIMFVGNLFILLVNYLSVQFANNRERSITKQLLKQYLAQDYLFFSTRHSSELIRNLYNEVAYISSNIISRLLSLISSSISVIGIILFIFYINPLVTLVLGSILSGAYALTYLFIKKPLYALGKRSVELSEEKLRTLNNVFRLMRDIKMQSLENRFTSNFDHLAEQYASIKTKAEIAGVAPRYLIEIFAVASLVFAIIFLMSTSDGNNILPTLGIYAFAGFRLMPALQQIFLALSRMQFSAHSLNLIAGEMRLTAPVVGAEKDNSLAPNFEKALSFKDVYFTYPSQEEATLKGLNFALQKNQKVAFIGRSGEGKSTLIDIISGLTLPETGRFMVDERPISPNNQERWRKGIGYASQNICLIDDTIDMNITLADVPEAIDKKHLEYVKEITLIDFNMDGAEKIGEDGKRLSGGQRQRLIIARALYQNKDLIILDEASSSMDSKTERAILQNLSKLNKTIIFISHNVKSLEFCDCYYLIQEGEIVDSGSYNDLKSSSSLFHDLINEP